jgi:cytosine/adenosine deaminase-related metal-dependent hydrolase
MANSSTSVIPTEVELALEVMPCQAMRRTYDSSAKPHACAYFAEWGFYHSFDYKTAGPPPAPGIEQPSVYRGKRQVVPEILSGCRKAPIMAVGINPNLPGWSAASRNAVHPYFEDYLQYAHYFRYRNTEKLRIPRDKYNQALQGRQDPPTSAVGLLPDEAPIALEDDPVTMYKAYQSLLDGLAHVQGWTSHKLAVGEDLSYANMVACGSARWVVRRDPTDSSLPVMGNDRARGIVNECFVKRRYFLRQLTQSLPCIILVFSATTAAAFIPALQGRFRPQGAPRPGETLDDLFRREIRLEYGRLSDGTLLDARVIFLPHASAHPAEFEQVRQAAIGHMNEEVQAGRVIFRPETGHLARPRGGCFFCSNALYRIGPCDYESELTPLSPGAVAPLAVGAHKHAGLDPLREKAAQSRLLEAFVHAPERAPEADDDDRRAGAPKIELLDAAAPSAPPTVLFGKAITMAGSIVDNAAIYLARGSIVAIQNRGDPPPAGFDTAQKIETGGVIYPGLLDLHNHLAYNILPIWVTPRAFENRLDWLRLPDYRRFVTQPMSTLVRRRPDLIRSIVRYVETKLLVGGVTSGQGMHSIFGGVNLYHGIVRNFEVSNDPALPSANHQIPDLDNNAVEIAKFRNKITSGKPFFFHLAEGRDDRARAQFTLLDDNGLIGANLIGIHCAGLKREDFQKHAAIGAKVVWSPLSNLLLYGKTLDVKALAESGVAFSLGSDWTPSGSRNVLQELKVAHLTAEASGAHISAQSLAESVTKVAARSAGWGDKLGTLEPGKYADLLVLDAKVADPYQNLLRANESNIRLVVVAGHIRYGDKALVRAGGLADAATERLMVGGREKRLHLEHPASPLNGLSLGQAAATLRDEMSNLARAEIRAMFMPLSAQSADGIELDMQFESEQDENTLLAALPPLNSIALDDLAVIDDPQYFNILDEIAHLPAYLKGAAGLRADYA